MKKFFIVCMCFFSTVFADDFRESIVYKGGKNYTYSERTDLRRYDNGKYTGLVSREIKSFISVSECDDGFVYYNGDFYVDEATKRNTQSVKKEISESIESSFKISEDGKLEMINDNGYPSFRCFPTYTAKKIVPGDKWTGKAVRAVDPLNKGVITKIPFYVEYEYLHDEVYNGEDVFVLSARWATRYGAKFYLDFGGDKELIEASGSHRATIYVEKSTGAAVVIRDTIDETFKYSDGNSVSFKGSFACFTKYPPSTDDEEVIATINRVAMLDEGVMKNPRDESGAGVPGGRDDVESGDIAGRDPSHAASPASEIAAADTSLRDNDVTGDAGLRGNEQFTVEKTNAGIRLTISNLQFKPDSSELVDGESQRLDQIAQALKSVNVSLLLVEGHTASTGNIKGEMELSKERAKVIAQALSDRGMDNVKFIVKGSGSNKPVAENSTKEGMAKNRRVEITILE
ncbi:MAG: OmpA family protein [Treponema sp.]|uniref:OmpA family protein n=1 Tax=Treponema sp. TaxID=166 RepID=UPI00298D8841|nr:OmpA family protein [Treponema sp.]MCR5386387.1 OmpA family protein [Treponema sp.]